MYNTVSKILAIFLSNLTFQYMETYESLLRYIRLVFCCFQFSLKNTPSKECGHLFQSFNLTGRPVHLHQEGHVMKIYIIILRGYLAGQRGVANLAAPQCAGAAGNAETLVLHLYGSFSLRIHIPQ